MKWKKRILRYINRPIALELSKNGYSIIEIIKNKKDNTKDVYIFDDTPSFRKAFDKVMKNRGFTK